MLVRAAVAPTGSPTLAIDRRHWQSGLLRTRGEHHCSRCSYRQSNGHRGVEAACRSTGRSRESCARSDAAAAATSLGDANFVVPSIVSLGCPDAMENSAKCRQPRGGFSSTVGMERLAEELCFDLCKRQCCLDLPSLLDRQHRASPLPSFVGIECGWTHPVAPKRRPLVPTFPNFSIGDKPRALLELHTNRTVPAQMDLDLTSTLGR